MTVPLRLRTLALAFFLFATVAAQAQVNPALIGPLSAGATKIQGVGDPAAGTTFHICIATTNTEPAPVDCAASSANLVAAQFSGAINPSVQTQLFSVTLKTPLVAGTFVYIEQQKAGAATKFSPILEVAAPAASVKPSLIGPLTAGTKTIQGIGDPDASAFLLCVGTTAPSSPPPDCSKKTSTLGPAAFAGSLRPAAATQQFSVTLSSVLTAGTFVYLEQKKTGIPPAFSPVLEVEAPTTDVTPSLVAPLTAGSKTIQGFGDSTAGTTFRICLSTTAPSNPPNDCSTNTETVSSATFSGAIAPSGATHQFSVTLNSALTAGTYVYLAQELKGASGATFSPVLEVAALGTTNEREQTEFVGGTLLSANGANYSQASLFLALNYDRTLWRPGWYSHKDMACIMSNGFPVRPAAPPSPTTPLVLCPTTRHPGLNTFFQARLTTIPVNASTNTTTTSSSGSTTPAGTSVSSFLAAQKTAQFDGGIFAPFLFGKVPSNKEKTAAFYIAPIARFGFSTPTGSPSGSSSTATTGGSTTTTTTTLGTANTASGQLYNYGLAGLRIATADLNPGALHTSHYFDVGIGKYSNLQSLVCKSGPPATSCLNATTGKLDPTLESRSTLFRLEFEGFLEIISANNSSLILGISANTGPGFLDHRANLDTNNRAAEDIEFLIGYKFDISQLLGGISIIGKNP